MKSAKPGLVIAAFFVLNGCANRPVNDRIDTVDTSKGYRANLLVPKRKNNDLSTLFVLSFSGGGTRAASLSYGVLEELRRVEYTAPGGQRRRLIDEIDLITGVSGGSFTALSYARFSARNPVGINQTFGVLLIPTGFLAEKRA